MNGPVGSTIDNSSRGIICIEAYFETFGRGHPQYVEIRPELDASAHIDALCAFQAELEKW